MIHIRKNINVKFNIQKLSCEINYMQNIKHIIPLIIASFYYICLFVWDTSNNTDQDVV